MEVQTQQPLPSTSALLKAVESLKKSGLSGIGNVIQTTSPEYLDATSCSEDSDLNQTIEPDDEYYASPMKGEAKSKQNCSSHDITSMSIHMFPGSVSHLGSIDGTRRAFDDMETVSIASGDVETVETATTVQSMPQTRPQSPLSVTALTAPTTDSDFSIEASTKHCARGRDLWAAGKCNYALFEFRKALLGLESLLGTNHLLISKLYHWMGQIFLQLLDDDDNKNLSHDTWVRRRALADAAVESLTWSLKIRYTQPSDPDVTAVTTTNSRSDEEDSEAIDASIEASLQRAWKFQAEGLPLSTSSRTQRAKSIEMLKDSIKIERKADLALFRMEKNQLSEAIDVYVSLVNQYNKSISLSSDDGAFSAMTKMAFWYHKLGRLRAKMDRDKQDDMQSEPSLHSSNSMPLGTSEHPPKGKNNVIKSTGRTYLEHAAFWYRMALEVFCTGIGRFDKISEQHKKDDNIDITTHPTYQQLLLRIEQVLLDHYSNNNRNGDENDNIKAKSYLESLRVWESVLHHFGAKQAMKQHQRLKIKQSDSLSRLKALQDNLIKGQDGFEASMAIEESAWGSDHQIVIRMRHELSRISRLKNSVELEISTFPAKQALKQKKLQQQEEERQKLEQEKKKQQETEQQQQKKKQQSPPGSIIGSLGHSSNGIATLRWLKNQGHHSEKSPVDQIVEKDRSRAEHKSKTDKYLVDMEILPFPSRTLQNRQYQHQHQHQQKQKHQKQQKQKHQKQKSKPQKQQRSRSPSGSTAGIGHTSNNGIETLRRLQDEAYQSQKLLEGQTAEKNQLRAQLQSKTGEILQAVAAVAQKEEEAVQWRQKCEKAQSEKEALQSQIQKLKNQVRLSDRKQGQLEFTRKKEGADLTQSATQKEVELEYWRQKFEAAQTEWTECQTCLEEELRKARTNATSREADLIEWRGKFEGLDGKWKTRQNLVERLEEENERLQRVMASGLAERKQLEFTQQMNDLEFTQTKEQEVLEALTRAAKSESDAASWKRKYDVAQNEWLAIQDRADEQNRVTIADATIKTAELSRWKKKFEIAQREWMECQTTAERQARGAIATAKQYEVSHSELSEKFIAAQNGLKSLLDQNKQLRKQAVESQSKQDQLEFTLKKQAIDFANFQETLNRKTAEAQIWKDQCQASQQAQKQISHEIQLSRATDGSLQERIIDLRQQNADLKELYRELQADQERKKIELEAKNKEVALVKEAALKRIRQLKKEQKEQKRNSRELMNSRDESKDATKVAVLIEDDKNIDLSDPRSLAAKLGRTQRALEYVEKDYKDSMEEIESLTKANNEMQGSIADAQKIISLLKTANNERIEHCSKLENENNQTQQILEESLDERRQLKAQMGRNIDLQRELDISIAEKNTLAAQVKLLKSRTGETHSEKSTKELIDRISTLEADLQESEHDNEDLRSDLKKKKLHAFSPFRKWAGHQPDVESSEEDEQSSDNTESSNASTINESRECKNLKPLLTESKSKEDNIEVLLKRCEGFERDLVVANHRIEDLQDELREYKEQGEFGDAKKEYKDLILAQDLERELEKSNQIRENLSSELDDYEEKVEEAVNKEKEFKKKLDASNKQIKSLRDSVRDLSKLNPSQHTGGKNDNQPLAILEDLESELEDSNEIRAMLSSELKACKEKIVHAEKKQKEFQWLSNEYSQLEDKLEESNQIREEMSTALNSLKKSLAKSKEKENESDTLLTKLSELERQLEESSTRNNRLQSQIDILSITSGSEDGNSKRLLDNISELEKELGNSNTEIQSLKKELGKVSEDLEDLEEENEELTKKYKKLEKQYQGSKQQAEQNSKSLSTMLEKESKEQERVRQKFIKLEKDLEETSSRKNELESMVDEMRKRNDENLKLEKDLEKVSERNNELKSRMDEMRKRNIENLRLEKDFEKISERNKKLESRMDEMRKRNLEMLSDHSGTSCQQCLALGDELQSTIEQNEKHIQTTENFQDDHDQLLGRYNFLEKELKEAIEQNEILESQLIAKEKSPRDEGLDNDDKYQDLNIRCIELEEELRDSNDISNKRAALLAASKTKLADLEAYADDTAMDLEQAESIIAALKVEGAGGGGEITLLLDRCNKLQHQLKESQRRKEMIMHDLDNSKRQNIEMKDEVSESLDNLVVNINVEDAKAENAKDQAVQELTAKLNSLTTAKEELETLLKNAIEESDQQKRLKGHVEKDRDYLDKMYNECKSDIAKVQSDLEATKSLLEKSNVEKEELERQLQIEKHVSQSLKTSQSNEDVSEENELEELYRQARDELSEVESMLFETEEELEALKSKYQKLQEDSKLPSSERTESELSEEINHDLQDLSRDELMVETRKALRKMQNTQTKVVDLQETNIILQAQLKSSLTFKEKSKAPVRRNNGGGGGFWSLGGGDAVRKTNDGNAKNGEKADASNGAPKENQNNDVPRAGRFLRWRGGAKGGDASNENGGEIITSN